MPELPEVETTVRDLNKKVLNRTFLNVWTDFKKTTKKPNFEQFKKEIKGKKIQKIWRRGKNIIFDLSPHQKFGGGDLSENKSLSVHQKLTGHLLIGKWELEKGVWKAKISGPIKDDPMNRFLHLVFWLDNGYQLALSDLRKFAKVELWNTKELKRELDSLGPEPLDKNFTFERLRETLQQARGKIKQVLMDQSVIAGIGNIYSDEILWEAKVHPFKDVLKLSGDELKKIYQAMRKILSKAIEVGGESISDYRKPSGEKGGFDLLRKVYRREGEKCSRCGTIIKRIKLESRRAHFCPKCQK